jgi:hypothetical protein
MAEDGNSSFDAVALDQAEKQFWQGLWDTACEDAVVDLGIDMIQLGPVTAAIVAEEPSELALNFILGAGAAGAMENGYLAAAVTWMDRHDVDFRVPLWAGLPEREPAEEWLRSQNYSLADGPAKLLRDGSPPGFPSPPGIDVYERVDPGEDEGFSDPLAESFGFAGWAATFFFDLPGTPDWRCYVAVDGDEPLAYVAMRQHGGVAVLALASRPGRQDEGLGQAAVLHRCIADAAAAGSDLIAVADAGCEPATADRESLAWAGFEGVARTYTWQPRARVAM